MFDMFNMVNKVKDFQEKVKEVHHALSQQTVEGESAAGMVKATVNGQKKLIKLEIDPSFVHPSDVQTLSDLVIAAVNIAMQKADELAKETIQKETSGMLPNIPGIDLSKFGI